MYQKPVQKLISHYAYNLNESIGKGSFSNVYKGIDQNTNQKVAIKVIDMKLMQNEIYVHLLNNEIVVHKTLDHPNILKIYDVFQTQNNTYIVCELCDKGKYLFL